MVSRQAEKVLSEIIEMIRTLPSSADGKWVIKSIAALDEVANATEEPKKVYLGDRVRCVLRSKVPLEDTELTLLSAILVAEDDADEDSNDELTMIKFKALRVTSTLKNLDRKLIKLNITQAFSSLEKKKCISSTKEDDLQQGQKKYQVTRTGVGVGMDILDRVEIAA